MQLEFKFKNINNNPRYKIHINDQAVSDGKVIKLIKIHTDIKPYTMFNIKIYFTNKDPLDTKVDQNKKIIEDKNFELEDIFIDGESIEDYRWEGEYHSGIDVLKPCLFFGPPGYFEIDIAGPGNYMHIKNTTTIPDWEEHFKLWTWSKQILAESKK